MRARASPPTEGQAIPFRGQATGGSGPLSYAWDFGDGATAAGTLTPTHAYNDDGTYTVTLTVADGFGQIARATTTVTVANVAPTVELEEPDMGVAGLAAGLRGHG